MKENSIKVTILSYDTISLSTKVTSEEILSLSNKKNIEFEFEFEQTELINYEFIFESNIPENVNFNSIYFFSKNVVEKKSDIIKPVYWRFLKAEVGILFTASSLLFKLKSEDLTNFTLKYDATDNPDLLELEKVKFYIKFNGEGE